MNRPNTFVCCPNNHNSPVEQVEGGRSGPMKQSFVCPTCAASVAAWMPSEVVIVPKGIRPKRQSASVTQLSEHITGKRILCITGNTTPGYVKAGRRRISFWVFSRLPSSSPTFNWQHGS